MTGDAAPTSKDAPNVIRRLAPAHVWPIVLLAAVALIFFWPVSLNRGYIPHGGGDLAYFLWPNYAYAAQSLRAGHVPLWSPALYSGYPFLADNQTAVFYPINWIAYSLASPLPYVAMEWLVVVHFWIAGWGAFKLSTWLVRRSSLALHAWPVTAAGLFAGIAYMLSDVFVTHVGNLNIVAVAAWLPWALWAAGRAFERRSAGRAAAAGIAMALAILAGMAQMALMALVALVLFGLWWAKAEPHGRRTLALLALILAVGIGLSALTVLPAIELTTYTARAHLGYDEASRYSLPWTALAGLISPALFGRGVQAFWGPWERVEAGFVGTLPLFLLGWAPLRANRLARFIAGLGVLGLLIALGPFAPFHGWLYALVPGFAQLRSAARFILLTDLALVLLAALGLARLSVRAPAPRKLWAWSTAVVAVGTASLWAAHRAAASQAGDGARPEALTLALATFAVGTLIWAGLAWWRQRRPNRAWLGALLAASAIELFLLGAFIEVGRQDPAAGFQHPRAVAFLQAQPGPTRIDNASSAWQYGTAAVVGLEDVGGMFNPLAVAAYDAYYWSVGYRGSPQYNFLGAQFVIADKDSPPADASFVPVFNEDPDVDIYLNTQARPRVSLIDRPLLVADQEAAWEAVHADGFDPAVEAVIEAGPALPAGSAGASGERELYYRWVEGGEFGLQVVTPVPSYLVMAEVWYPGWQATVDGRPTEIYRANYAFRAVLVPAGEHQIAMRFQPVSWNVGLAISSLTAIALLGWGALWLIRSRGANARRLIPAE